MMKSFAGLIFCAGTAVAGSANCWNGWVVGPDLGVSFQNDPVEIGAEFPNLFGGAPNNATGKSRFKKTAFQYGAHVGYQSLFQERWYLDFEIGVELNTSRFLQKQVHLAGYMPLDMYVDSSRSYTLSATIRPGIAILPNAVLYLKGSALRTGFSFGFFEDGSPIYDVKAKKTANLTGWGIGAGAAMVLDEKFSVRFEYTHESFQKFKDGAKRGTTTYQANIKPRYHVFSIALNYKLGE